MPGLHQSHTQLYSHFQLLTRKQHLEMLYYPTAYRSKQSSHSSATGSYCFSSHEAWEPQQESLVPARQAGEGMLAADVITGGMVFDQERQQQNDFFISRSASCL